MRTGSRSRSSGPSEAGAGIPWRQLRLGAALLAGLVLASLAVFFLDVLARETGGGARLVVAAPEARELVPGATVRVAGVPAGRVTRIHFRPPGEAGERRLLIHAELRREAAELLRADAGASVRVPALLAPAVLALRPGEAPSPLDLSDTLVAVPGADPRTVMARADSLMRRLERLRPLGRRLARRLEEGPGTLAALRRDPATTRRLRAGLRQGTDLARASAEGSAVLLAGDSLLARRWDRIRRRSGPLSAGAAEAAALARRLDGLVARLARLGTRLDSAEGSLGRFVHDDALRREGRLLRARVDSVRAELLVAPLRWLRFRLR